jgi:hypothetical protein
MRAGIRTLLAVLLVAPVVADYHPAAAHDATVLAGGDAVVSAGMHHTCEVMADTTVRCWGTATSDPTGWSSPHGQNRHPTTVPGLDHVRSVSAGRDRTCVLLDTGGVDC